MEGNSVEDIAPELLKKIQDDFHSMFDESEVISALYAKVRDGTATYMDANDFAVEVGEILSKVYKRNISSDVLPDGKMYYNIARRIINPTMKRNYELITSVTDQVQKALNDAAHIGVKPITPKLNQDRIDGIINRVSSADYFDDVAWILDEPPKNFSQSIVDDAIRANAEFHGKAGMSPKIVRKLAGGCCDWCREIAGIYSYPDVPKDVYRRHQRCRCTVDYNPGNGKVQNVHSKKWRTSEEIGKIERRKAVGIDTSIKLSPEKGKDVTTEYVRTKYPGQGSIVYDEGYEKEKHGEEINAAQWLHKKLGGDIKLLNESSVDGVKMPDYIWRGKYWELKTTSTEKAANSAIRKGIKQIAENPGGIILNYEADIDLQEALQVIEKRMKGSKQGDIPVDIMIIQKEKLIAVLRY